VPITPETAFAVVSEAWPEWQGIALPLSELVIEDGVIRPLQVDVTLPDSVPSRAYLPVEFDSYTGAILQSTPFNDHSTRLRARFWIRFLHTGAAAGLPGKVVATNATAASLILVWTGFALS